MNYKSNMAKSPNGATLGERITIRGGYGLHYKAGKKQDDLTVEQLVAVPYTHLTLPTTERV